MVVIVTGQRRAARYDPHLQRPCLGSATGARTGHIGHGDRAQEGAVSGASSETLDRIQGLRREQDHDQNRYCLY